MNSWKRSSLKKKKVVAINIIAATTQNVSDQKLKGAMARVSSK